MSSRRPGTSSGGGGGGGGGGPKLRMDRQPALARISDPSLPIGRRKEIDSVMKKARANNSGDYWDKKLLDIEEKDPNRWRHTGFKKMYIEGDSSPDNGPSAAPEHYRDTRDAPRRNAAPSPPRIRDRDRIPLPRRRSPRSPPRDLRREMPPMRRGRSPGGPSSRRPPSPPPKFQARHRSRSSHSSYSAEEMHPMHHHHPAQYQKHHHQPTQHRNEGGRGGGQLRSRSRSVSIPRSRPRSPVGRTTLSSSARPLASTSGGRVHSSMASSSSRDPEHAVVAASHHRSGRPVTAVASSGAAVIGKTRHIPLENLDEEEDLKRHGKRSKKMHIPEDPRLARQRPVVAATASSSHGNHSNGESASAQASKKRVKAPEKLRARVKIEGEKRKKKSSSEDSDSSSSSESEASESIPTLGATTRMTLSERFGKMAQWSADRSNMDNLKTMRITKDSAGGQLKVMIEEQAAVAAAQQQIEVPPRREYSPVAPIGHFPEELALTAPSGLMSWDDVRVRYDYYKSRGYLRDLDLQDYVKWEEWWYKYQEWLKQERYYEFWERQQMRRRRKKIPIAQRLN